MPRFLMIETFIDSKFLVLNKLRAEVTLMDHGSAQFGNDRDPAPTPRGRLPLPREFFSADTSRRPAHRIRLVSPWSRSNPEIVLYYPGTVGALHQQDPDQERPGPPCPEQKRFVIRTRLFVRSAGDNLHAVGQFYPRNLQPKRESATNGLVCLS